VKEAEVITFLIIAHKRFVFWEIMKHELSEKWIRASIAGTIWAASEIVLGSFLHNLRVPFSGNILTAIGIIILVSINYTWAEKGLFWRAGLICAILKTMSPSAVIFGPMIGIIAESFLLELFVRLLGRTYPGYMFGAMAAMSWNLFQKIAKYIIFYGANIVGVYTDLLKFAQKQLNIETDIVWLPIIFLLIIYALFGLLAAIIGIRVGHKMLTQPAEVQTLNKKRTAAEPAGKKRKEIDYSVTWLIADIVLIIGSLVMLNFTSWIVSSVTITCIIVIWSLRYRRALRRISNPKFWIVFILITLITAFAFSIAQTGQNRILNGLITGIQMNFRAALIIVGFSGIGTELYSPVIRDFFSRTSFKNLPVALELSAKSLPDFIAGIPDFKTLVKNPVSIFYDVISHANNRLSEIKNKSKFIQRIFIVCGSKSEGKTAFVKGISDNLVKNNISVGGILSERIMKESVTTGYDIVDIVTGQREVFLRQNEEEWEEKIGKFSINSKGLAFGRSVLNPENQMGNKLVIIDEVGMLELDDKGWALQIRELIDAQSNHLIITARDTFTEDVRNKWGLTIACLFKVSEYDPASAAKLIIEKIGT
jgi:nucleoside-triphosphatase THEP1